jgi:hypothetical protein
MGDFKRLVAWQKAHAFGIAVHCEDLLRQGDEVAPLCFSLTRIPPQSD